jgi:hypothetical protein
MPAVLMATLHWDPQLRGFLILLTAVLILPGSVYLLLLTNLGARVGLLVALAGLSGWMFLLATVWAMYGNLQTGDKGPPASWRVVEIVSGDLAGHAGIPVGRTFPKGWTPVPAGSADLAQATATADNALIQPATPKKPAGPFKTAQDFVNIGGYQTGGHNYLFRIGSYHVIFSIRHHHFFLKHQPHYFVVRVQPALPPVTLAGAATTLPAPNPTQPLISVVMVRDVGSVRKPPIFIALSALIIFGLTTFHLHRRDKEIMRLRALSPAPA